MNLPLLGFEFLALTYIVPITFLSTRVLDFWPSTHRILPFLVLFSFLLLLGSGGSVFDWPVCIPIQGFYSMRAKSGFKARPGLQSSEYCLSLGLTFLSWRSAQCEPA